MPLFTVNIEAITRYCIEDIEADSEDEALEIAVGLTTDEYIIDDEIRSTEVELVEDDEEEEKEEDE